MKIVKKIETKLLNFRFEEGIRNYKTLLELQRAVEYDKYDPSILQLKVIFKTTIFYCFLKVNLNYNSEFALNFQPSLQEWRDGILSMVYTSRKALNQIECLKSKEIGSARESNMMKIFQDNDEMIQETDDNLEKILDFLFGIPEILAEKMKSFSYLHENSIESYKKKLKKMHFEEISLEIKKLKLMKKELEENLFLNLLPCGLFLIDVEGLKVILFL